MIRLRQIKLNIDHDNQNNLLKKVAKKLQISENDIKELKYISIDKKLLKTNYEYNIKELFNNLNNNIKECLVNG